MMRRRTGLPHLEDPPADLRQDRGKHRFDLCTVFTWARRYRCLQERMALCSRTLAVACAKRERRTKVAQKRAWHSHSQMRAGAQWVFCAVYSIGRKRGMHSVFIQAWY